METTRHWLGRSALAVVGAVLALGAVTGGSAFADMDLYRSGSVHSWRTGADSGIAAVMDTKTDGDSVYAKFNRNYPDNTGYRVHNSNGMGSKAYSSDGSRIWDMQACVDVNNDTDDCSDWWTDNHNHG